MSRRPFAALLGIAAALFSVTARAEVENQPIEEKRLVAGRQTLSSDKGYIYLHTPVRGMIMLVKEPSPEELAAYQAEWQEAFAKAREQYPRRLRTWEKDVEWARKDRKPIPARPVEPTADTFAIDRLDQRMIVTLGPQFIYAKQGEEYSYLHELEPGTYRYYGPVFLAPNGVAVGTCYCMGSVKFEVEAGRISNLGDFLSLGWVTPEAGRQSSLEWNSARSYAATDYSLPERLAAFPNAQAAWRAAGKIDNFYGIMVGRIPPVPGVLGYERDTVIDLKGAVATSRPAAP